MKINNLPFGIKKLTIGDLAGNGVPDAVFSNGLALFECIFFGT
jgi:hypothetical protein